MNIRRESARRRRLRLLGVRVVAIACSMMVYSMASSSRADEPSEGPSFNCKRATSQVNRMICASPELSALDRQLASDYQAAAQQAGVDGQTFQSEQTRWLREVRNGCATEDCLKVAYRERDSAILDMSLRAASPAAYDDTRPFTAPASAVAAARAHLGESCGGAPAQPLTGTTTIAQFHMVVARGGYVVPLAVDGQPFAFWLAQTEAGTCTVRDVVVLPPSAAGTRFMQCHLGDDSHGFAIRSSNGRTVAYWSISEETGRLRRDPIHVIGEQDLRCQEPETGD